MTTPTQTPEGINFLTCTMDDVIARSLLLHPSLFGEALARVAGVHLEASRTMVDGEASRIALDMSVIATVLRNAIASGEFDRLEDCRALDFNERMIAFGAAYKLQCISHALALDIASRQIETDRAG